MIVLIPAYEPDDRLVQLVQAIVSGEIQLKVVVVDDGSGPAYSSIFAAAQGLGADIVRRDSNHGKGYTLKQGFAHIAAHYPTHDVVCADCDGQHTPTDITRVAAALDEHREGIVLGARQFKGDVPAKSRVGNDVARGVYHLLTGQRLQDTQTGLRAYPASMLAWLQTVDGDRFEYELEVLLAAQRAGVALHEVPIDTVYVDDNHSTHFRPFVDSILVLGPFVRFSMSSIAAFLIDSAAFFTMMAITGRLGMSIVVARVISASANFVTNRRLVFRNGGRSRLASAVRYASLVAVLLAVNYALMRLLTGPLGLSLVPAKLLTELGLFLASYNLQRRVVFARSTTIRASKRA